MSRFLACLEWRVAGASGVAGRMMRLLLIGLAGLMPVAGRAAEYTIGPSPAWVVPVTPGVASADQAARGSDGVAYLLTDTQILASEKQRVTYYRVVSTALNASGVDSVANIEIPFDPAYQTLVLHSINIVRHGRVIPKLATAKIQVLQRETELETRIYDGTKTVNVFLEDVRAGDTIDYAYSRIGRNPVFKGLEYGTISLQYGTPVARIYARLLLSSSKHVTLVTRNSSLKASMTEHDGWRDYLWDIRNSPALTVEKGAPEWYAPLIEADWSEFPDWAAVAHWAQPLYQVPASLSPALQAEVNRIMKTEPTPAGRMLAALRTVQEQVRYLGVEIGQNSHAPNPPAMVFDRRFGDCKDKTLLTLTLLQHLGIEAHPALVNTSLQRGVADVLPNPGAFDHVLVQARVDGRVWWIDPTRDTQKADLAHLFQPDYGLALVVDSGTRGLAAMQHAAPGSSSRHLQVVFDARAGFDKPVRFTVQTTAVGEAAESLRASLASSNLADVQKNYLNFYADDYPHIAVAAPLQVSDDEQHNSIVTKESYVINDMASLTRDKRHVAEIYMTDVAQVLRDPEATIRESPLQLTYPQDVSEHIDVLLPDVWPANSKSHVIDDPAFRFEKTVKQEASHLTLTDHFQAKSDEVAAKDMRRYLGHLSDARDADGYQLTWGDPVTAAVTADPAGGSVLDRMNWVVLLLAAGMLGFFTWLAVLTYRYDPMPRGERDPQWVGIGGWLLLLAVVLACRPVTVGLLLSHLPRVFSIRTWSLLTTYGSSKYNALWAPTLLFELASLLAQFVFSILLLLLFFQRRSSFPRVAWMVLSAALVLYVCDHALASLMPGAKEVPGYIAKMAGAVVGVVVWSAYLARSQRVKSTFRKRYRAEAASPPPLPGNLRRSVVEDAAVATAITGL